MFLLNIYTRRLESFPNDLKLPSYYILSHVWGDDEVSYQDVRDLSPEALTYRKGWQKIEGFCEMLLASESWIKSSRPSRNTVEHVWVDTCCINKDSSAELSEAINSMYAWYSRSVACIAYLEDVATTTISDLQGSRWFTRGWTLQELLSPTRVHFYSATWEHIGDRYNLADTVCECTGIHPKFLEQDEIWKDEIWKASIAEKMSWAAKRETTRSEDIAYCLMGLFGINMPLLYGEGGERAFIRLQEEILKESTDESIFAWDATGDAEGAGMLAVHPSRFRHGDSVIPLNTRRNPEAVKNGGIIMNVNCLKTSQPDLWNIVLDCTIEGAPENKRISLQVLKGTDCSRTPMPFSMTSRSSDIEQVFFTKRRRQIPSAPEPHICEVSWDSDSFVLQEAWPGTSWSKVHRLTEHQIMRTQTLREVHRDQSFHLNVRRAWRLALNAGMTNSQRLVAALALSCRGLPCEIFVLGIMFTLPDAKYALVLKKLRGNISPTSTSESRISEHWADVSGMLEAWANKKITFEDSHSPYIDTPSRRVTTQSSNKTLDRRNGVVIRLSEELPPNQGHEKDYIAEGAGWAEDTLDPLLLGFEPMTVVPGSRYWKSFGHQGNDQEKVEVSKNSNRQGPVAGSMWHRMAYAHNGGI